MAILSDVQYETVINQLRSALRTARDEVEVISAQDPAGPDAHRRRQIVSVCDLAIGSARIIPEVEA